MQSHKYAPAGFGARLAAYLFDTLLAWLISALALFPVSMSILFSESSIWNAEVLFSYTPYAIAAYCIRKVYFVISTWAFHKTLGKKIMHIQVDTINGEKLTFLNVLIRETVGRFLSGILYIGYLISLAGKDHYALHDMICDTKVCYTGLVEAPPAPKQTKVQGRTVYGNGNWQQNAGSTDNNNGSNVNGWNSSNSTPYNGSWTTGDAQRRGPGLSPDSVWPPVKTEIDDQVTYPDSDPSTEKETDRSAPEE